MFFGQSVPVLDGLIRLTYVRNTGAAFSMFLGFSPYLAVIGIAAVLAIMYFHFKMPKHDYYMQIALSCVLGGSLGNVFDRLMRSYVIDYIDFKVFPVFNFADIMINIGMFLIIIRLFNEESKCIRS
jgi:signal peptidase II